MSVYDVSGNGVTELYSEAGDSLDVVYDKDGNLIYFDNEINNIVSYFREPTLSVKSAIENQLGDWTNIIFITDMHGRSNQQHSQAIGIYLLHKAPIKMLVLGGDFSASTWDIDQYNTYVAPFLQSDTMSKIYAVMGNHETYGSETAADTAKGCIYNDFLSAKNLQGVPAQNYYYLDDANSKTRYLFINTSDSGSAYVMTQTQLTWIENSVILPDSSWNLVVFGHVNLAQMAGVTRENESNGSSVIAAINNCNGTIVGYFCGHQHIDYCEKIGDFQHTTFQCDKLEYNNYYPGVSFIDRGANTVTEQAVTVISINVTTKQVITRRIGAARDDAKIMTYTYT